MTLDEIARPIFDEKYSGDWQNFADGFEEGYNYNEKKLSKAKELLQRCYDTYIYEMPIRREIEQFLGELNG